MSGTTLTEADLDALRQFDTPTICNALEVVAPARRLTGFTVKPLVCPRPQLPPIVGYARTGRIRAMVEPGPNAADRVAYYEYVAAGQGPMIAVLEDLDPNPGYGAFWGEVNTNIHKAIGCLGVVTNGSIRDLPDCAEGFQLLAGSVGPSHAHVHMIDFGGEVTVQGMAVRSGDLVHADQHGAVVIPHGVARQVPDAARAIARREAVILEACRKPGAGIEAVKAAIARQKEIH